MDIASHSVLYLDDFSIYCFSFCKALLFLCSQIYTIVLHVIHFNVRCIINTFFAPYLIIKKLSVTVTPIMFNLFTLLFYLYLERLFNCCDHKPDQ